MQKQVQALLITLLLVAGGLTPAGAQAAPNPQFVVEAGDEPLSICNDDDRVASNDSRVGRLSFLNPSGTVSPFCTAWLVGNGAAVTAGHCVNNSATWPNPVVVEFNVPASNANGMVNAAAAADQYPVQVNSIRFRYDGEDSDGADWAVFRLGPNATTGRSAHVAQGFFRVTNRNPSNDANIRITGYGVDDGAANRIQQTHVGDYDGENDDEGLWHEYNVDTAGANSGSPIIWDVMGLAIGIHSDGGCDEFLGVFGSNSGTSFENGDLANALVTFPGPNVIYVDTLQHPGAANGHLYNPYNNIGQAVTAAGAGAQISIAAGNYPGAVVLSRPANSPVVLTAPVGPVVLGQ
jgi:V8-like Glu-specific endopeptidase